MEFQQLGESPPDRLCWLNVWFCLRGNPGSLRGNTLPVLTFTSCLPQERQEKALGILTYLGQSAAEAQTQPPWYQLPPRQGGPASGPGPDERIKSRLDPLWEMQKHLGKKRKHSGDSGGHSTKEKKAPEKQRPNG